MIAVDAVPGFVSRHVIHPDGSPEWLKVSVGLLELTGFTPEDLRVDADLFRSHIIDEDRERVFDEMRRSAAEGRDLDVAYRFRHRDGRTVWLHSVSRPEARDDGSVLYTTLTVDVTRAMERQMELRQRALDSEAQLRAFASRLLDIREEERSFLARELHDQIGQALTALLLELSALRLESESLGDAVDRMARFEARIQQTIRLVQTLSAGLRPPALEQLGLVPSIEAELAELRQRTDLVLRFDATSSGSADDLPEERALALFRVLQEALVNVVRHARARHVDVRLRCTPKEARLEVVDDGVGIPDEMIADPGALGLLGMRERMVAHRGRVEIDRPTEGGTRVRAILPAT